MTKLLDDDNHERSLGDDDGNKNEHYPADNNDVYENGSDCDGYYGTSDGNYKCNNEINFLNKTTHDYESVYNTYGKNYKTYADAIGAEIYDDNMNIYDEKYDIDRTFSDGEYDGNENNSNAKYNGNDQSYSDDGGNQYSSDDGESQYFNDGSSGHSCSSNESRY